MDKQHAYVKWAFPIWVLLFTDKNIFVCSFCRLRRTRINFNFFEKKSLQSGGFRAPDILTPNDSKFIVFWELVSCYRYTLRVRRAEDCVLFKDAFRF